METRSQDVIEENFLIKIYLDLQHQKILGDFSKFQG